VTQAIRDARGPRTHLPWPAGTTAKATNYLLREAAWHGNAEVVRSLIVEEGADPNFRDELLQETPIYAAIRSGNVATVETLLKHGANPNVSTPNSGSPLAFVEKALRPELASGIIKALIDGGARIKSGEVTRLAMASIRIKETARSSVGDASDQRREDRRTAFHLCSKALRMFSNVAGEASNSRRPRLRGCSGVKTGVPMRTASLASIKEELPAGADNTNRAFANSMTN
jgi:hypothetical protein